MAVIDRDPIRELGAAAQGAGEGRGLSVQERQVLALLAIAAALRYVGDVMRTKR